MAPAMPCKTCKKSKHGEIRSKTHDFKSNFACISEASESKRMLVWKNLYQIIMRTMLQERVTIHYKCTIWYTNLFSCLKPWRFPLQKQQWIKYGNLKRFWRGTWQKSETNQRWSMKQGRSAEKFILPHWWTSVIWRMPNWRQSAKNTKVELYSEATFWTMILNLMQYSLNKGHQHHKWQQRKSWITYPDCHGAQDNQLTQYLLVPW